LFPFKNLREIYLNLNFSTLIYPFSQVFGKVERVFNGRLLYLLICSSSIYRSDDFNGK